MAVEYLGSLEVQNSICLHSQKAVNYLKQGSATHGPHPARSPFTNFSNDTACLVYFILLICPSCNYLALYACEKLFEQKSNFMGWRKALIDSTTFSCTTTYVLTPYDA